MSARFGFALLLGMFVFLVSVSVSVSACLLEGQDNEGVKIGEPTNVCLVINGEKVSFIQPEADTFSRFSLQGSYNDMASCDETYYASSEVCPFDGSVAGCPSNPPASGFSTNFYVESMGVQTRYKKLMANPCSSGGVTLFPLLTVIVTVLEGKVVGVNWDDGCYMCDPGVDDGENPCILNAYNTTTNQPIPEETLDGAQITGKDCAVTQSFCDKSSDKGLCDMNVYVVWTGDDVDGRKFTSAGRRFERFRDYAMPALGKALEEFDNAVDAAVDKVSSN